MFRLKTNLAAVCLATALAFGQMPSKNVNVGRVGSHLACTCGCKDTVASCSMPGCGGATPMREKIARMQKEGRSDKEILDAFITENGPGIYRGEPNAFGWLIPYAGLALGAVFILWFIRKAYQPRPATVGGAPVDVDPKLARYNQQIEKDLADFD